MSESEKRIAIFMHIPKTAGSTLRRIVKTQYKSSERCMGVLHHDTVEKWRSLSPKDASKIKCMMGHVEFGIHRYLSRPYTYITVLRDPIEQVISEYYYILGEKDNPLHKEVGKISFEDFITINKYKGHTSNRQTRFISGGDPDALDIAKQNLGQYFSVVGITEMFDHSLFLIKQELGWGDVSYEKFNVTKHRPKKEDLPRHVIELLRKNNEADIQLYQYGKELFENKIQALNPEAIKKLKAFVKR